MVRHSEYTIGTDKLRIPQRWSANIYAQFPPFPSGHITLKCARFSDKTCIIKHQSKPIPYQSPLRSLLGMKMHYTSRCPSDDLSIPIDGRLTSLISIVGCHSYTFRFHFHQSPLLTPQLSFEGGEDYQCNLNGFGNLLPSKRSNWIVTFCRFSVRFTNMFFRRWRTDFPGFARWTSSQRQPTELRSIQPLFLECRLDC